MISNRNKKEDFTEQIRTKTDLIFTSFKENSKNWRRKHHFISICHHFPSASMSCPKGMMSNKTSRIRRDLIVKCPLV